MQTLSAIFVAFVTSVLTTTATVYVIQRYDVLSDHAPSASVPDLRGLSEPDARQNLSAAGLTLLIAAREVTPGAKVGTVVQQSIAAGQRIPHEHPVSVTLAEEPPVVPDVGGLTLEEATRRLERAGYKVQVGEGRADAVVPEGHVLAQAPAAASQHAKDALVTLQVSTGPIQVSVPKLNGMSLPQAKTALEGVGLSVGTVRFLSLPDAAALTVLSQKPLAGDRLRPGTEVELTVNR